jgi:hypothetical protein
VNKVHKPKDSDWTTRFKYLYGPSTCFPFSILRTANHLRSQLHESYWKWYSDKACFLADKENDQECSNYQLMRTVNLSLSHVNWISEFSISSALWSRAYISGNFRLLPHTKLMSSHVTPYLLLDHSHNAEYTVLGIRVASLLRKIVGLVTKLLASQ